MNRFEIQCRILFAATVLTGCSAYGPGDLRPGDAQTRVLASMGEPTARYALNGGAARLVYARGPMGQHTWMVDVGADGRVAGVKQVLGEAQFSLLPVGITSDELLREFGPPAHRRGGGRAGGEVWSYRYPTFECRWFQVSLGDDRRVQGGSYGTDPMCDPDEREDSR